MQDNRHDLGRGRVDEDFFSNTSHLIRTPLNGVIGMTELLLETELTSRQRTYTETVLQSGERLLRVVEDILDYSKLEAGTMRLETGDFELRTLLRRAANPFMDLADEKGLFLHYSVGHDVPDALRGDADRIRQVVSNFLRHSVANTAEGEVYLRAVLIEDSGEAATIRFEVIDTAPGVPPEERDGLFAHPSVPLGESISTGMELAISKRLADLMGGEVGAEGEPGEGNLYSLELRLEKQPEEVEYLPAPRIDLKGLRALVVGGDPTGRELLLEQLASWEARADHAEDGPRALEALREAAGRGEPHDLVILDTDRPDTDTLELARTLNSEPSAADARLVLLSSAAEGDLDLAAHDAGAAAVLTKPLPARELFERLTAVAGSRTETPAAPAETTAADDGPRIPAADLSRAHVLVVEDDPVNRLVATRMLENIGCTYDVAKNGREAVEALRLTPYSAVLMDVQMPEMDGYEATAEIRAREGAAGGFVRRTPIIAMTANAMAGDRERTIEAGMDDYLSKPVKPGEIEAVLARWAVPTETVPPADVPAGPEGVLDTTALGGLRGLQVEGEPDILGELVDAFIRDAPGRLSDMRAAILRGDAPAVEAAARSLKGGCGDMGAVRMVRACEELEETARSSEDLARAPEKLARLEDEFARARAALEAELGRG